MKIRGVFVKDDSKAEQAEAETETETEVEQETDETADEVDKTDDKPVEPAEVFVDERQMAYVLVDNPRRDIVPGFSEQLIGVSAHEERQFILTFPDDEEDENLAGRTVDFEVTVTKIQSLILPEMDDFMAELASDGELKTLDELHTRLQERLTEARDEAAKERYQNKVLNQLAEEANISYPDAAIEPYIDDIIAELEDYMTQSAGINLETYAKYVHKDIKQIREENRERALQRMRTSLVIQTLTEAEKIKVSDEDIDAEIERQLERYEGEQAELIRQLLESESYRERIENNLVTEKTLDRLVAINKGEAPELEPEPTEAVDETDPTPGQETATESTNEDTE
jgi:trigger factor